MKNSVARELEGTLRNAAARFPAVVLTGPRQTRDTSDLEIPSRPGARMRSATLRVDTPWT